MDFEFDELKREFLTEATTKVDEIASLLQSGGLGAPEKERAFYLAHQLKGAGGSYGFSVISTEAAALEKELEKDAPDPAAIRQRVTRLGEVIRERQQELAPRE
jgi:HPt (histidine-containing phosphotransfer) domain-containing protein